MILIKIRILIVYDHDDLDDVDADKIAAIPGSKETPIRVVHLDNSVLYLVLL